MTVTHPKVLSLVQHTCSEDGSTLLHWAGEVGWGGV